MNPQRVTGFTLLFLHLFTGCLFAASLGSWEKLQPAPSKRTEVAVALLKGKIYLIGGFTPKGITGKVEAYDPGTETWEEKSPLPKPLHHTTAAVVNGKLYVIGGFTSGRWTPTDSTFEYDPDTDQWTEKQPMPTGRGSLAVGVIGGKIYAVGGALRKFFRLVNSSANEVYDPATDRWQQLPAIPTPRDHLTVSTYKGVLYAIGGRINVDYGKNLNVNEAYDPKSAVWTQEKALPTARSGITSQVLNGKIHVLGGESKEGTFRENEAYDPETDEWTTLQPMPSGRHGLGSAVVKGKLHVLTGGPKPGGGGSKAHWVFSLK